MRISDWSSDVCSSDLLEFLFQMLGEFVGDARDEAIVNQVLRPQTCGIAFADKRMLANLRVHQRLREARLVYFVATEAAIAPPVDHDVAVHPLPVFDHTSAGDRHHLRILDLHMHNGTLPAIRTAAGTGSGTGDV